MQCKLFKGLSPDQLESSINDWLASLGNNGARVFIHNVQQYTIGEVTPLAGIQQIPGQAPNVKYIFNLLVLYSLAPVSTVN